MSELFSKAPQFNKGRAGEKEYFTFDSAALVKLEPFPEAAILGDKVVSNAKDKIVTTVIENGLIFYSPFYWLVHRQNFQHYQCCHAFCI